MNEAMVFSLLIGWVCKASSDDLNKIPSTYVSDWRKQALNQSLVGT